MRRVLALALVGAAGYAGWRFWRSGGLGGGPSAGASLDAIEAYEPGELRAELDTERAGDTLAGLIESGRGLGDPFSGADVLEQVPQTDLARQLEALVAAGRATIDDGIRTTGRTTRADRRVIAEAECRRASVIAGVPVWQIDDCTRALGLNASWAYVATSGGRGAAVVHIGYGGLGDTDPPATPAPIEHDPITGRPRPPRTL